MSLEAQRVYLTKKMQASASRLGFPISYPNQTFNIPVNAVYGEFHIIAGPRPIVAAGEGKGKARTRRVGMVQLTVYIPKEKGTKAATVAGDTFSDIFQLRKGRDTAGATYKFDLMQEYTPTTKAGWECYVFRVPFTRDTVETVHIEED